VLARLDPFGVALVVWGGVLFVLQVSVTSTLCHSFFTFQIHCSNSMLLHKFPLTIFKQIALNESKEVTAALSSTLHKG
jgi:hypothetical protein